MNNIKSFFGKKKTQDNNEALIENEKRTVILPPPIPNKKNIKKYKDKPYQLDLGGIAPVGSTTYNNVVGILAGGGVGGIGSGEEGVVELSPTIYCVSDVKGLLKQDRKWIQISELDESYLQSHFTTVLTVLNFLRRRDLVHYIFVDKPEQISEINELNNSNNINGENNNCVNIIVDHLDSTLIPSVVVSSSSQSSLSPPPLSSSPSSLSSSPHNNNEDNNNVVTPPTSTPKVQVPSITLTTTTTNNKIPSNISLLEDDIKNEQAAAATYKQEQSNNVISPCQSSSSPRSQSLSPQSTLSPRSELHQFENDDSSNGMINGGGLNTPNAMLTPNNVSGVSYSFFYPGKKKRIDANRIFSSPGQFFKYPEEYPLALEKQLNIGNPKDHFKNLDFEARGGFGSVFCAKNKNPHSAYDKQMVALKKMPIKSARHKRMNISEIGFLKYFNHPNIVKYISAYQKPDEYFILIMEFMEGGTLKEAVNNFKFCEGKVAYICREILKGLEYLHSLSIAHRDLKTANVMVNVKGDIKLIDFGLAIDFSIEKEEINMLGSPSYISPEMVNGKPHSLSTDIWSFGICFFEMMTGKVPCHESRLKSMVLVATNTLPIPLDFAKWSPEACDFYSKCLDFDPSKRWTASQLLAHPFIEKACQVKEIKSILPALFMSNTLSSIF